MREERKARTKAGGWQMERGRDAGGARGYVRTYRCGVSDLCRLESGLPWQGMVPCLTSVQCRHSP